MLDHAELPTSGFPEVGVVSLGVDPAVIADATHVLSPTHWRGARSPGIRHPLNGRLSAVRTAQTGSARLFA